MVTPPKEVLDRIRNDAAQVRAARATDRAVADFRSGFVWPATGIITGVYGSQRILNGKPRQPHYGIDIAAATGTPVVAPADGVITLAATDHYYTGGTVILDHGHGLSSTFIHLDRVDVAVGDRLEQGQPIGTVGASGRATGPHLDWRINWFDRRLDPAYLVPPMPAN
jgi:murein DD-endopeptidase MepM/ murein hydrolase activator NlpD